MNKTRFFICVKIFLWVATLDPRKLIELKIYHMNIFHMKISQNYSRKSLQQQYLK